MTSPDDLPRVWIGNETQGELCDARSAVISVFDHGFTVGDGVFETLRVQDGMPFALSRHLRRLAQSASALGLQLPSEATIREAIAVVTNGTGGTCRLRITVTGGPGPMGSDRSDTPSTLAVVLAPVTAWPPTTQACVLPWLRNERSALAGVKSTSYAENVIALQWAKERGASEALFANTAGQLCEGTGSNVFVVKDGQVTTPTLASGCLAGITRELVLEWCPVAERDVPIEYLMEADEVFITSSTRDVHPVSRIDGRHLQAPGPVTAKVQETFAGLAASNLDP